ncbi:hypothetical protein C8046_13595 [Serinibacter arcticus]|uniref:ABC3 transporter permease C-terminal domain-containing protein n=1 Tax=Serinibacter arcticus TaxID=1655435 RepID=A0A2U1ZX23_9MICO|nr:FtsX-like permease family protein [Serinibacter arcticus]PWD51535.1 hypothetical protein C8046_13595 [Serinibacter arcticus]
MTTLRLWLLLRRRSSGSSDPAGLTSVLAVIAFAVTTAISLVVVGGLTAFVQRSLAVGASDDESLYIFLAAFATMLLLVPLATLGGAAARLAVARRDARLAALRLAGATNGQVATLTVLDAGVQAVLGAVIGVAGYAALLPAVAQLRFQGRPFDLAELWVGVPGVLAAVGGVLAIALFSSISSLGRVAITPLGVAARTTPPALHWFRLVSLVVAVGAVTAANAALGSAGGVVVIFVLMGLVAAGMATLNLLGPFVLGLIGRIAVARARTPATLLAGRRIVDDPKTAWRSVGGVALATFIAGITAVAALFGATGSGSPDDALISQDIATGGMLTLAIAGLLAGVSTGVMQAGRVIDQRQAYRNLVLAGTETRTLDAARFRETLVPLLAAVGTAAVAMLVIIVPLIGVGSFAQPVVLVQYVLSILGASALVLLGAAASTPVARRMVAQEA